MIIGNKIVLEEEIYFMQDKKSFGKYIAEKRKKINLTQEELANRLYVIPTTISKWERGITYPDISMITNLCKELNISEHEFFTACDDVAMNKERKEIQKYRLLKKWVFIILNLGYLISIITCFICNLVIDHTLSWFFIVLVSMMISFSITSLFVFIKNNKYRFFKVSLIVTGLIYLLLFTINCVTNGYWLMESFLIATFVFIFLWASILICTFTKMDTSYKTSISLVLLSFIIMFTNPFCNEVLNIQNNGSNIPNIICGIFMLIIALLLTLKNMRKSS